MGNDDNDNDDNDNDDNDDDDCSERPPSLHNLRGWPAAAAVLRGARRVRPGHPHLRQETSLRLPVNMETSPEEIHIYLFLVLSLSLCRNCLTVNFTSIYSLTKRENFILAFSTLTFAVKKLVKILVNCF